MIPGGMRLGTGGDGNKDDWQTGMSAPPLNLVWLADHYTFGSISAGGGHKRPPYSGLSCLPMVLFHPQRTEPPLTLRISPVMWRARSDARKTIGPAMSLGGGMRPIGIVRLTFSL